MRKFSVIIFIFLLIAGCTQAVNSQNSPDSDKTKTVSGNPILSGWYADPEGVIFGKKYWVFPTFSALYEKQVFLDAFSSEDLVNWQKHEHIIDTSIVRWANKAIWAPCIVEKDGKYFLFFSANDIQTSSYKNTIVKPRSKGEPGGIGICVASRPEGPYKDYLSHPLIDQFYNGAQPIDQYVFKDTDGQYYIIYGGWRHCNIGKLKDDFSGLKKFNDSLLVKEITPDGYVEGPTMFLRNGTYYLMWSEGNWTDESYKVAYGISKSVSGPFKKVGTILQADTNVATGAGHHSVINIPGTDDWYIIYHRRPIPNLHRDHRVTCIDKMFFNTDGSIKPVVMTKEGVEKRVLK